MRVICAFLTLIAGTAAFGGNLETVIAPPAEPTQAGQVVEFSVYIHNMGNEVVPVQLPARVSRNIKKGK